MKVATLLKYGTLFRFSNAWEGHSEFGDFAWGISLGANNDFYGNYVLFVGPTGAVRSLRYEPGSSVDTNPGLCFEVV